MIISYLITLYNKQDSIADTILSIDRQFGDFGKEIIIVDDGSTDDSANIAKNLLENMQNIPSKIVTQKNAGPSAAVNTGIKLCTGDFVYLVDGDDYIYPDSTISMLNIAKANQAKLVRGRHTNNFALDKNYYNSEVRLIANSIEEAIKFFPIGASTTMVDRELLIQVGGCDDRVFIQDYSLTLRLAPHCNFIAYNKLVAHHIDKQKVRISQSKLKENYNTSLARMLFCTEMDLTREQKILSLQVQLKKSSSWLRKTNFLKWVLSKHLYRNIVAKLAPQALLGNYQAIMKESLEVYDN